MQIFHKSWDIELCEKNISERDFNSREFIVNKVGTDFLPEFRLLKM